MITAGRTYVHRHAAVFTTLHCPHLPLRPCRLHAIPCSGRARRPPSTLLSRRPPFHHNAARSRDAPTADPRDCNLSPRGRTRPSQVHHLPTVPRHAAPGTRVDSRMHRDDGATRRDDSVEIKEARTIESRSAWTVLVPGPHGSRCAGLQDDTRAGWG